jgi:hypothetical protein
LESTIQIGGYNRLLMLKLFRRFVAIILLVISLVLIIWASIPDKNQTVTQTITPEMMQLAVDGSRFSLPTRQVTLEWPVRMRIGEDEMITLSFMPTRADPTSPGISADYTDPYDQYSLVVEGRFDVAAMKVDPANPRRESMPKGQPLTFHWQINTDREGTYNGTIWLSLRYLPLDGSEAIQVPIYIDPIDIVTTSLFGMTEATAYLISGVGILLALAIVSRDLIKLIGKMVKPSSTGNDLDEKSGDIRSG